MIRKTLHLAKFPLLSGLALALGFARELTVSSHFGLSPELDVYVAVLGFYTFFGVQIANVLEMVFISKSAGFATPAGVTAQLARAILVLLGLDAVIAGLMFGGGGYLLAWIFPGFSEAQQELGLLLMGNLVLAIVFANVSGLFRAALNVLRLFAPGMLAGSLISLCSIAAVLLFSANLGIRALLYGFILGNGLVLLMVVTLFLATTGPSIWRDLGARLREHAALGLWKAAFIVFAGELFYQGYTMTERSFAVDAGTGTVSAFFYAWALVNIPLALVVMPASNVIYPRLAQAFAADRSQGLALLYRRGGLLILYGLLIAAALSWGSEWIVRVVFLRGKFTLDDARLTAHILAVLVYALPFMCFSRIVRYSLYSLSNYAAPTTAQFLCWLVMTGLARVLVPCYGIEGLAYASVMAISVQPVVMLLALVWMMRRPARVPVAAPSSAEGNGL